MDATLLKLKGWLFPVFGKHRHSMENWFFPSSDVMSMLKNFPLKSSIFQRPRDITCWEKPVFHGEKPVFHAAPVFAKNRE